MTNFFIIVTLHPNMVYIVVLLTYCVPILRLFTFKDNIRCVLHFWMNFPLTIQFLCIIFEVSLVTSLYCFTILIIRLLFLFYPSIFSFSSFYCICLHCCSFISFSTVQICVGICISGIYYYQIYGFFILKIVTYSFLPGCCTVNVPWVEFIFLYISNFILLQILLWVEFIFLCLSNFHFTTILYDNCHLSSIDLTQIIIVFFI